MGHYPRIRIHDESGAQFIREALCLRLYMSRFHREVAPLVMQMLGRFAEVAGSALGKYIDDEYYEFHRLDERGWSEVRQRILRPTETRVDLHDESNTDCRYRFHYIGGAPPYPRDPPVALCAIYCWLPTEYLEEHGPERLVDLALHLLGPLPICSGTLGLAFNHLWNDEIVSRVKEFSLRHPGLEIVQTFDATADQGAGVNGISWLTFLGQPILGELGGTSGLRARLSLPTTTVRELDGDRVVIRLGAWPESGDLESGDNLPGYRELARVLEPWLVHAPPERYWRVFSPEELQRWERRFLD